MAIAGVSNAGFRGNIFVAVGIHFFLLRPSHLLRPHWFEQHALSVRMASIPLQRPAHPVTHDDAGATAILSERIWHCAMHFGKLPSCKQHPSSLAKYLLRGAQ